VRGHGGSAAADVLRSFRGRPARQGMAERGRRPSPNRSTSHPQFPRGVVAEEFAFADLAPYICADLWPVCFMMLCSAAPLRAAAVASGQFSD